MSVSSRYVIASIALFMSGITSACAGLLLSVVSLFLPGSVWVPRFVTMALIAAFPLLMLGAHFLDIDDRECRRNVVSKKGNYES
ncbi:hypothetical protein [Leptolyngbya sp. 7M]|uniref:hypothetical protein n=1 Tax=Leptolyngbya sp. 7M TaxID=2812896 RepID=UPI001B8D32D1|nr:hypothetical protein [Leptolyngbya sp. 7M]QYO67045.1 hypothetical protein JVX88_09660 [Leptolyngbya sp. 7M]